MLAVDVTYPAPVQAGDGTDQNSITSTTPVLGSPVVGVVFTAPPSGRVRLHLFAALRITTPATGQIYCGVQVRAGSTIGSGTLVFDGIGTDPGCRAFLSGMVGYTAGNVSAMLEALIPGASYNCSAWYMVGAGTTGVVMARQVAVDPLP